MNPLRPRADDEAGEGGARKAREFHLTTNDLLAMTYATFRDTVQQTLRRHPSGLTWAELRSAANLPYQRPCPEWTKQLENDIGLSRAEKRGNALIWRVEPG